MFTVMELVGGESSIHHPSSSILQHPSPIHQHPSPILQHPPASITHPPASITHPPTSISMHHASSIAKCNAAVTPQFRIRPKSVFQVSVCGFRVQQVKVSTKCFFEILRNHSINDKTPGVHSSFATCHLRNKSCATCIRFDFVLPCNIRSKEGVGKTGRRR